MAKVAETINKELHQFFAQIDKAKAQAIAQEECVRAMEKLFPVGSAFSLCEELATCITNRLYREVEGNDQ